MVTALISGSLVLLVGAAAALALGWGSAKESYILGSMVASLVAGVLLVAAWVVSKRKPAVRKAEGPDLAVAPPPPMPSVKKPVTEDVISAPKRRRKAQKPSTPSPPSPPSRRATAPPVPEAKPEPAPLEVVPGRKEAKTRAKAEPAAAAAVSAGDVIAIPDRKRFHTPECRFAKAKGAERMSKASARRRGYVACGICKP